MPGWRFLMWLSQGSLPKAGFSESLGQVSLNLLGWVKDSLSESCFLIYRLKSISHKAASGWQNFSSPHKRNPRFFSGRNILPEMYQSKKIRPTCSLCELLLWELWMTMLPLANNEIPALLPFSAVMKGKFLNLCTFQFSHWQNHNNNYSMCRSI